MDAKQIEKAIAYFWDTKAKQLVNSGDSSNRGSVVGGKQMDGFVELLRDVAIHAGIPEKYIITDNNYLPGLPYFVSKAHIGAPLYFCGFDLDERRQIIRRCGGRYFHTTFYQFIQQLFNRCVR